MWHGEGGVEFAVNTRSFEVRREGRGSCSWCLSALCLRMSGFIEVWSEGERE